MVDGFDLTLGRQATARIALSPTSERRVVPGATPFIDLSSLAEPIVPSWIFEPRQRWGSYSGREAASAVEGQQVRVAKVSSSISSSVAAGTVRQFLTPSAVQGHRGPVFLLIEGLDKPRVVLSWAHAGSEDSISPPNRSSQAHLSISKVPSSCPSFAFLTRVTLRLAQTDVQTYVCRCIQVARSPST